MIASPLLPAFGNYVNGVWTTARSTDRLRVTNPATGDVLAEIPVSGGAETDEAIRHAAASLADDHPAAERQGWLEGIAAALLAHREEFGRIITLEQGKPLAEAVGEVEYAAGFFSFFATQLTLLESRELLGPIRSLRWTVHHRPAGVAGLITPWNFPVAMMAKKFAAALGAGCPIVAKPAEATPLSAIALWHLAAGAGVPAGKIHLVIGDPASIGKALCEHPAVRVLSFTGSTQTGVLLLRETAAHIKRLSLELGGNAPFVVFDDADVAGAVDALVANKLRCAGQTCVCANRVYVQAGIHDAFVDALAPRLAAIRAGDGMDPASDIGPLINRAAFDKVAGYVADALARGAVRRVGYDPARPTQDWGCFYPATLLTGLTPEMRLAQEEIFGPVVAVGVFRDEAEAFALANQTSYGLAGYVFTRDPERARRCARQMQVGHLGANTGSGPTPEAPFGGMKHSGFGREGGGEGLLEFCETQTVASGGF